MTTCKRSRCRWTALATSLAAVLGVPPAIANVNPTVLAGTASGTSWSAYASADAQWRYDIAYQQCMYAKGNQLPGYVYPYRRSAPVATPYYYPPPPPPRR